MLRSQGTHIVFRGHRVINFVEYARKNNIDYCDLLEVVDDFVGAWYADSQNWHTGLKEAMGIGDKDFDLWRADANHIQAILGRFNQIDPDAVRHQQVDLIPGYQHIAIHPDFRGGAPCFYGHAFQLYFYYSHLQAGGDNKTFKESFPWATEEMLVEAVAYAIDRMQLQGVGKRFFAYYKSFSEFWIKTQPHPRHAQLLAERFQESLKEGELTNQPAWEAFGWSKGQYNDWRSGRSTAIEFVRKTVHEYEKIIRGTYNNNNADGENY